MLASILVGKVNQRRGSRLKEGGFFKDPQKKPCLNQDLNVEWMGRRNQTESSVVFENHRIRA